MKAMAMQNAVHYSERKESVSVLRNLMSAYKKAFWENQASIAFGITSMNVNTHISPLCGPLTK